MAPAAKDISSSHPRVVAGQRAREPRGSNTRRSGYCSRRRQKLGANGPDRSHRRRRPRDWRLRRRVGLFGVPGSGSNLDLVDAAGRAGRRRLTRRKPRRRWPLWRGGGHGAPGARATTLGPGAASVVNGMACANRAAARLHGRHPAAAAGAHISGSIAALPRGRRSGRPHERCRAASTLNRAIATALPWCPGRACGVPRGQPATGQAHRFRRAAATITRPCRQSPAC